MSIPSKWKKEKKEKKKTRKKEDGSMERENTSKTKAMTVSCHDALRLIRVQTEKF